MLNESFDSSMQRESSDSDDFLGVRSLSTHKKIELDKRKLCCNMGEECRKVWTSSYA